MKTHANNRAAAALIAAGLWLLPISQAHSATNPPSPPGQKPAAAQPAGAPGAPPVPTTAGEKVVKEITLPMVLVKNHTDDAFVGRTVRTSDDEKLGRVEDLLLNPASGEIDYAVVASGGVAGFGATLRLVPFRSLAPDRAHDLDFKVSLTRTQWEQLAAFDQKEFDGGMITISDAERRRLAQAFARAKPAPGAAEEAFYTAAISRHLMRASRIRGQDVRSGGREIGDIEALIVDPDSGKASVLFHPEARFLALKAKFEVPLNQFFLGTDKREGATTSLTREDFEPASLTQSAPPAAPGGEVGATGKAPAAPAPATKSASETKTPAPAQSAKTETPAPPATAPAGAAAKSPANETSKANVAAKEQKAAPAGDQRAAAAQNQSTGTPPAQSAPAKEPALAPTGKSSAEQAPAGANDALLRAAQAIRAALDNEAASLARIDVRVNPENGRVVLRGAVADDRLKKSIEEKAAQAAKGAKIDSQITLEGK